jgi:hypothetical protein
LEMIDNTPSAQFYIDKVLGRVGKMLDGEVLGHMVDSDIENLDVDHDFEM